MSATRKELRGTRSLYMSRFHRMLAREHYATDIDFVEFDDNMEPVAIIESKSENEVMTDQQLAVITRLAEMANLPFFIVWYDWRLNDIANAYFMIEPQNLLARGYVSQDKKCVDAAGFNEFLFNLRGRHHSDSVVRSWRMINNRKNGTSNNVIDASSGKDGAP